jgi:hypothetical protein
MTTSNHSSKPQSDVLAGGRHEEGVDMYLILQMDAIVSMIHSEIVQHSNAPSDYEKLGVFLKWKGGQKYRRVCKE